MKLQEKQAIFCRLTASLIHEAWKRGYTLTFGEAWRPPETAAIYARQRKGIKNSLHTQRLAVDFNLFRDGKWLTKTDYFEGLGLFWESLSTPGAQCTWGGRFGDGCHFSITHNGIK